MRPYQVTAGMVRDLLDPVALARGDQEANVQRATGIALLGIMERLERIEERLAQIAEGIASRDALP